MSGSISRIPQKVPQLITSENPKCSKTNGSSNIPHVGFNFANSKKCRFHIYIYMWKRCFSLPKSTPQKAPSATLPPPPPLFFSQVSISFQNPLKSKKSLHLAPPPPPSCPCSLQAFRKPSKTHEITTISTNTFQHHHQNLLKPMEIATSGMSGYVGFDFADPPKDTPINYIRESNMC